ncbi:MAG: hypothetical protein ACYCOU_02295 [Sulfobacillus sp.]
MDADGQLVYDIKLRLKLTDGKILDGTTIYDRCPFEEICAGFDQLLEHFAWSLLEDQHGLSIDLSETHELMDVDGPVLRVRLSFVGDADQEVVLDREPRPETLSLRDGITSELSRAIDDFNGEDGFLQVDAGALYL